MTQNAGDSRPALRLTAVPEYDGKSEHDGHQKRYPKHLGHGGDFHRFPSQNGAGTDDLGDIVDGGAEDESAFLPGKAQRRDGKRIHHHADDGERHDDDDDGDERFGSAGFGRNDQFDGHGGGGAADSDGGAGDGALDCRPVKRFSQHGAEYDGQKDARYDERQHRRRQQRKLFGGDLQTQQARADLKRNVGAEGDASFKCVSAGKTVERHADEEAPENAGAAEEAGGEKGARGDGRHGEKARKNAGQGGGNMSKPGDVEVAHDASVRRQ